LLVVLSSWSLLPSEEKSVAAQSAAPLGTEPLRVSGFANYTFGLAEGTYYLGMASEQRGIIVEARLTQGSQTIAEKQVVYWGARHLGLLSGEYHLALRGQGTAIIASDAQRPGRYQFAGLATVSLFLLPPARTLDIAVLAGGPSVSIDVLDGLMTSVVKGTLPQESLKITLPEARDEFAYVVISAPATVVEGTFTWRSFNPGGQSSSMLDWAILLTGLAAVTAIVLLHRRHRLRSRLRNRRRTAR
jgi:hypothetical protein